MLEKLGGLEFEVFRARQRISEHCKHLEQVFGGKRANLEARAAQKTQDTKNVGVRFSALFAPKTERRRCGDIAGDKGFLAEI